MILPFFREHLVEGELPQFSDTVSSNRVVISKALATKLRLKLGDKIDTYYIQDDIRARRLQVVGIYQTNFMEVRSMMIINKPDTMVKPATPAININITQIFTSRILSQENIWGFSCSTLRTQ